MSDRHVDSSAVGGGTGNDWANAYTTLILGFSTWSAGDRILIAYNHSEAGASFAYENTTSLDNNPLALISVDPATGFYRRATAAQVDVTGSGSMRLSWQGSMFGCYFSSNGTLYSPLTAGGTLEIVDSTINLRATSGNKHWQIDSGQLDFKNSDLKFPTVTGDARLFLSTGCGIRFQGGTITGRLASVGGLCQVAASAVRDLFFYGVDLSTVTVLNKLIDVTTTKSNLKAVFSNCKVPVIADTDLINQAGNSAGAYVDFINCDSAAGIDVDRRVYGDGTTVKTSLSTYHSVGAVQFQTGVRQSHEFTPGSDVKLHNTRRGFLVSGFAKSTGSKVLEVELAHDFSTDLKLSEIFIDGAGYLTASDPLHSIISTSNKVTSTEYDPVTPGAAVPSSIAIWVGAGGLTKQKLSAAITIAEVGYYTFEVVLGRYEVGKSVFYDPFGKIV